MFTGIIKNVIKLDRVKKNKKDMVIHLMLPFPANTGDSVSVNGACLTVSKISGKTYLFDVSYETVSRSNLFNLNAGDWVNVESSLTAADLLHGHLVYGHIDGVGKILNIQKTKGSYEFIFDYPSELSRFIAEKGSIALDGVSLTITEAKEKSFKIVMVKHTLLNTNFKYKKRGDVVNIEIDPLARYLQRLLEFK
jgi:riboflavin synthase